MHSTINIRSDFMTFVSTATHLYEKSCVNDILMGCLLTYLCPQSPYGDIYSQPYTYCRWQHFVSLHAAHMFALKHILSPAIKQSSALIFHK